MKYFTTWLRYRLPTVGFAFIGAFLVFEVLWISGVEGAKVTDIANVTVLAILTFVTAFYARSTQKIAKETEELAEVSKRAVDEARKQRQDAFLPVLDIFMEPQVSQSIVIETLAHGFDLQQGKIPDRLTCRMKNVGVGPALYVQYQIIFGEGVRTLTENSLIQGCEFKPPATLAIVSSEKAPYIQITCRDVFGRTCTSRKDILANFRQNTFELGPLRTEFSD